MYIPEHIKYFISVLLNLLLDFALLDMKILTGTTLVSNPVAPEAAGKGNKRMVKGRPKPTPVKAAAEVIFDPLASGARKPRRPGVPSASKEWHSFMVCLLANISVLLALQFLHVHSRTHWRSNLLRFFPSRDRVSLICIGSQFWRNLLKHLMRSLTLIS